MAVNVTINGNTYALPETNEEDWGSEVTSFFQAIGAGALTRDGGTKSLLAELDLGATHSIKAVYFKSRTATPASTGIVRLANTEGVSWRNAANDSDLALAVDASNQLTFNGSAIPLSGAGSIADADISASAAITLSKLAGLTASRALVSDGSGVVSASSVTATELGYLSGVTSALQTQIDTKADDAEFDAHTSATAAHGVAGDLVGTTDSQALSGKTLLDPVIDDSLVFVEAASSPAAPNPGYKKLYAKTDGKVYTQNSDGTEQEVGSGAAGGSGKNYITNPSASSDTAGWVTSNLTLTRETDTALLPRGSTTGTGFKAVSSTDGGYAEWQLTLDAADENAANLLYKLATDAADSDVWKLEVYEYPDATFTDAAKAEIALVGDDSNGDYFIPATPADVGSWWTPNTYAYIGVRLVHVGAVSNTIYFSDSLVGPSSAASGHSERSPGKAGFIQAYSGATIPDGWLECDGSAVSRITYSDLFTAIGTMYGVGDGSTTFNLPDYRGYFLRGMDDGAGNDPDAPSRTDRGDGTTGDAVGTKQADAYKSHAHDLNAMTGSGSGSGNFFSGHQATYGGSIVEVRNYSGGFVDPIQVAGGNETRPKNVSVIYIIKAYDDVTVNLLSDNVVKANARATVGGLVSTSIGSGVQDIAFKTTDILKGNFTYSSPSFTVPADGDYEIYAVLGVSSVVTTSIDMLVLVNGSSVLVKNHAANTAQNPNVRGILSLSKGDVVKVQKSSSGSLTGVDDVKRSYLHIARLADYSAGQAVGYGQATADTYGLVTKNRWQKKTLLGDITASSGTATDLTFSNLVVGKVYRVTGQVRMSVPGTGTRRTRLNAVHDTANIAFWDYRQDDSNTTVLQMTSGAVFTATASEVTFTYAIGSAGISATDTWMILEELNNYEAETGAFTA